MARHLREPAGGLERPGREVVGECAAAWPVNCVSVRMLGGSGAVGWPCCELRQIPRPGPRGTLEVSVRINETDAVTRPSSSRVEVYGNCGAEVPRIDVKSWAPGSHPEPSSWENLSPADTPAGYRDRGKSPRLLFSWNCSQEPMGSCLRATVSTPSILLQGLPLAAGVSMEGAG